MELLIKIPDEAYELLKSKPVLDNIAESIITNGTPLPKGHGDLIDRNALITELETDYHRSLSEGGAHLFVEITSYIDDAETIIAADKETQDETNC